MINTRTFFIYHQNEVFRNLIKEMLTKIGYYHILESASFENPYDKFSFNMEINDSFILVDGELITKEVSIFLKKNKKYIILCSHNIENIFTLSVEHGVQSILTFPFSSQSLSVKINDILKKVNY